MPQIIYIIIAIIIFTLIGKAQETAPKVEIASFKKTVKEAAKSAEEDNKNSVKTPQASASNRAVTNALNGDAKPLSLQEAIKKGLENNPDIEISRQNVKSTEYDLEISRGSFDFRASASTNFNRTISPSTNFLTGTNKLKDTNFTNSFRLERTLQKNGTSVFAEFSATRSTTNNGFFDFPRSNQTSLNFGFVQPLYKGRKFDESRRRLEISKKNLTLSDQQFRQKTIDVITSIQTAYWDLSFALKDLQMRQETLKETKLQLESVKRRIEQGEIAPVETLSVERQIAEVEVQIFNSANEVERTQNNLKNLLANGENDVIWQNALLPSDEINRNMPTITLNEAITEALKNRVELQQIETSKEINKINQSFYKEQLKPQVDLTANYSLNGFAGKPNGTSPNNLNGGYLQSLQNLGQNKFNAVNVGLTINFPVGNRANKAEFAKNEVEGSILETQKRQFSQSIQAEVRTTWSVLQNAISRLESAKKAREAAEKEYESESRKFSAGRNESTTFSVIERLKQVILTKQNEIASQTELNKAVSNLEKAIGSILKSQEVEIK
jgi:outer membrane protein